MNAFRNKTANLCLAGLLLIFISCNKNNENNPAVGGQLPTRYVTIRDTAIIPAQLTLAVGNSITFLNQTNRICTVLSDDSLTIRSGPIDPGSFYFFKKDTTGSFGYRIVETPALRGLITLVP